MCSYILWHEMVCKLKLITYHFLLLLQQFFLLLYFPVLFQCFLFLFKPFLLRVQYEQFTWQRTQILTLDQSTATRTNIQRDTMYCILATRSHDQHLNSTTTLKLPSSVNVVENQCAQHMKIFATVIVISAPQGFGGICTVKYIFFIITGINGITLHV